MERLENAIRPGESVDGLVWLLRGGVDTNAKLLRQAALLEGRFTFDGRPARGFSLFAAYGDLDARLLLGTRLRSYPKYRRVSGPDLTALVQLLPTFQAPHWTVLLRRPGKVHRPEETSITELLDTLGPALNNPRHVPDRPRKG